MTIEYRLNLAFPIDERNFYLVVNVQSLDFDYLDTVYTGEREEYILYRIPTLKLFSPVDPQKTTVKFLDTSIKVCEFEIKILSCKRVLNFTFLYIDLNSFT